MERTKVLLRAVVAFEKYVDVIARQTKVKEQQEARAHERYLQGYD